MKSVLLFLFWGIVVGVGLPVFILLARLVGNPLSGGTESSTVPSYREIIESKASSISPGGSISEAFSIFSAATDFQRKTLKESLSGKIVEWHLQVYNVSERRGGITIQTQSTRDVVGTFCIISAEFLKQEKFDASMLKYGDNIICKCRVKGTSMRNIVIDPAVILRN